LPERLPFQVLHYQKRTCLLFRNFEQRAYVRMVQGGGGASFTPEAFQHRPVVGNLIGKEFQSHKTAEADVLCHEHDAHAATAQLFNNPIMGDGLSDELGGNTHVGNVRTELGTGQRPFAEAVVRTRTVGYPKLSETDFWELTKVNSRFVANLKLPACGRSQLLSRLFKAETSYFCRFAAASTFIRI
jgi:hypothetical protein